MHKDSNDTAIAWNDLVRSLAEQKCVLFIGPDLLPGEDMFTELLQFLGIDPHDTAGRLPRDIKMVYPGENLFLFDNDGARTRTSRRLEEFHDQYSAKLEEALYTRIARLPFPLIVSTMPDLGLHRYLDKNGINHQFGYYNYRGTPDPHDRIHLDPRELRLLFNLRGVLNQRDSLVLTHDDLFLYFSQILGDKKLSSDLYIQLPDTLKQATDFIFLGFQFDHWPMQLLLRLLNPDRDKGLQYAMSPGVASHTRVFYSDQFQVEFVDKLSPEQFLAKLCEHWEADEQKRQTAGAPLKQTLRDWLRQGLLQRILEELRNHPGSGTDADHLMGRLSTLRQSINEGVVNSESIFIEYNRIRKSIQDIIDQLP